MNVSLFQAASALNANARWQELISDNLAASALPGFKKLDVSFATLQGGRMPAAAVSTPHYTMPRALAGTNFTPGPLRPTGLTTDVALEGPGFLAVQLPDGNTAYTRNGALHLDATGQLVTQQGYAVLGEGGPLQLDLGTPHTISISPDGQVSQGVEARGRLRAVEFEDPKRLTRIGQGLFLAQDPTARPSDATQTRFHQGALEAANTVAATEMASLLTALRLYEANQRVIQTQDDRMGKAIAELGQPA